MASAIALFATGKLLLAHATRSWRTIACVIVIHASLISARGNEWKIADTHPRLLIGIDDVALLRVRSGIGRYRDDPVAKQRGIPFGAQRDALDRLRTTARDLMLTHARADDLFVPAILHLVTGELDQPDTYTAYITSELLDPARNNREGFGLHALAALDWCWNAIEPEKRSRIIERASQALQLLDATQSPLDHLGFTRKLNSLAAAIVLADGKDQSPTAGKLKAILASGQRYLEKEFSRFCRERGAMPTSGQNGIWEETDLVLAAELWRSAAGPNAWKPLADNLGRSMEHYFYADTEYAGMNHGFIHDDGSDIPLQPGRVYRGFVPAAPWAIARATRDPFATWFANRSLAIASRPFAEMDRYQWVRLVYGPLDQPEAARKASPLARNLGGGWVVMRSGWAGGDTVLLFDAGQPFWRARQHFDAGQFQIYRKGRLAINSGDDVAYEAIPSKGGQTTIGGNPGDWDDYAQSTIAHNCITVSDTAQDLRIYGRPWPAIGNQRLIEGDYTPANGDIEKTPRNSGRLTAFETNSFYSYAAADLTAAYPADVVRSMQRRILFVHAGAVVVLDRVATTAPHSVKAWHLQLPSRPSLNGAKQIHGVDDSAGIWELGSELQWLTTTQQDGRLFVRTLLPARAQRRVLGGPMRPSQIASGAMASTTYFGGNPLGYEHRLWPASILKAPNAAYELGRPTNLGPNFGVGANWGRLDVSPTVAGNLDTFLHVLIPTDRTVEHPPNIHFETKAQAASIRVELGDQYVEISLDLNAEGGGTITFRHPATHAILFEKSLATR